MGSIKMKSTKTTLDRRDIIFDEELYPRNQHFWQTAYAYSESMKLGNKFPLVVVAKLSNSNAFVLVDGKHRLEAYKILKVKRIKVEVLLGLSKNQIYEEAIRRNTNHGQRFSIQEKLSIAVKLRYLHYSTAKISQLVQVSPTKLKSLLSDRLVNSITGEDIVLKADVKHLSGSHYDGDIETVQRQFRGNEQLPLIQELCVLLETKTINLKSKKVLSALLKLKTLLRKIKSK